MSMNAEAKEIIEFILGFQQEDPDGWWNKNDNIVTIQTIVNSASNASYDDGFKCGMEHQKAIQKGGYD